jgi:hypothetical protein
MSRKDISVGVDRTTNEAGDVSEGDRTEGEGEGGSEGG